MLAQGASLPLLAYSARCENIANNGRGDDVRARVSLDVLNFALAGAREGFGPFIAVYLQAQGFDPAATGIVMSLAGVGGLTCTTPIGAWVDRSVRKRELLMLAVAVIAVGAITIVAAKSIYLIGFAQLLIGIGDTALAPLLAAMTLGIVGHAVFADRMSRNEAFNNAGNATRSALAAALGYFFGLQYVAVTIVLSAVVSSLVVRGIRPDAIDHVVARAGEIDDQPTWRVLLRMRGLMLLALVVLVYQAASSAMLPFLAEARTAAGSDPSLTTGAMCVISRGFMVPAALLAPYVARRRGYAGVMTIVLAMVAGRAVLAYFAHSWAIVILVEMMEGLSVGMALVAIPVLNADVMAGTGRTNAALGLVLTTFGAGATISPLLGGFIANRFGFGGCFIAYAMVAAVGMVIWIAGRRLIRSEGRLEPAADDEAELAAEPQPNPPIAAT